MTELFKVLIYIRKSWASCTRNVVIWNIMNISTNFISDRFCLFRRGTSFTKVTGYALEDWGLISIRNRICFSPPRPDRL